MQVFECIGGLNSVALTDSIQAVIMIFAFISIPIIIRLQFGGWSTLTPETYPRPEFYQTPSADSQVMFWQFALINFSFFTLPHFIQRIYAAKDLKSLKIGYAVSNAMQCKAMLPVGSVGRSVGRTFSQTKITRHHQSS
jgi:Na+/proline symporter